MKHLEEFINHLDLPAEIKNELKEGVEAEKIKEFATTYRTKLQDLTKQNLEEEFKKKEPELVKQGQIAAYSQAEKKLAASFGLDLKQYEAVKEKRLEKMIEDAIAMLKNNTGGDVEQLKEQLKAAQPKIEELNALKENQPKLIEAARDEVANEFYLEKSMSDALSELTDLAAHFKDEDMIRAKLAKVAKISVVKGQDGTRRIEIRGLDGKFIQKSATENFEKLSDLLRSKVLPQEWFVKQQQPPTNQPPTPQPIQRPIGIGRKVHTDF